MKRPSFLALVGPTASGKTELACEIAKHLPVEVISCDSMQVYRDMPHLTQAPSAKAVKILRAHLVSFLDLSEEYNAALFRRDALTLIEQILKRGRIPLIVGGTGLYLRALLDGLFENENSLAGGKDETYRKKLLAQQEKHGGNYLHEKLKKVDAVSSLKIHPNDFRRLIRALEIFHMTGQPFSAQKQNREGIRGKFFHRMYLLNRDRADLYGRINRRVDRMLEDGLLAEVKKLQKKKLSQTAMMALGFREMCAHLEGRMTLPEALELLRKNTRHYAKRQLSWFRHERDVQTISVAQNDTAKASADKILKDWEHAAA